MKFAKKSIWISCLVSLVISSYCWADELPAPYNDVVVLRPCFQGWFRNDESLQELFDRKSIKTVIEVGSWLGKSTMWMAERLPPDGKIYAVDHWLGSVEHQPGNYAYRRVQPRLFQQFLSNVIHRGLTDKIVPVRMTSVDAAAVLDVKPDLIYIDASHDYESVKEDLEAWFPFVGRRTVFCGDDYPIEGVRRAVDEFAEKRGYRVAARGRFWRILAR